MARLVYGRRVENPGASPANHTRKVFAADPFESVYVAPQTGFLNQAP